MDLCRAIVGEKALNGERKRDQQPFQGGNQIRVTDVLHRIGHLKWRDLVHRIEGIHALLFVPIALMARIDTEKAGLPRRMGLPVLSDGGASGRGLLDRPSLTQISGGFLQVVRMTDGDGGQSCVGGLPKQPNGPLGVSWRAFMRASKRISSSVYRRAMPCTGFCRGSRTRSGDTGEVAE
jgi:hypothetical protein